MNKKMSISTTSPAKTLVAFNAKHAKEVLEKFPDIKIQHSIKPNDNAIYGILPYPIGLVDFSGISEYLIGNPVGA